MITTADIEKLFSAQLARIKNTELRALVVAIWVAGCKEGGWESVADLMEMPFTLLVDTEGVNLIEHTIAVTEGAIALAKSQQETYRRMPYYIDMDRLIAGGLLHDVGKLLEIEKVQGGGYRKSHAGMCARHPVSGAMLASKLGLDNETINTIVCHAKEGEGRPQTIETILIHQADFATFNPIVMLKNGMLIH